MTEVLVAQVGLPSALIGLGAGLRSQTDAVPGRLFMALQAYIDDSIDDSGIYVLAGHVATAEQWSAFSKEWEAMLPMASLNDRDERQFKMANMAKSADRMSKVPAFHTIINSHVIMSIACVIDKNELKRAVDRIYIENETNGEVIDINWGKKSSPFYNAYHGLIDTFHNTRIHNHQLIPIDEVVDFYFDESSEKQIVLDEWEEYLASRPEEYRNLYGSIPRFENDEKFLPLQAADFRAWWVRKWAVDLGKENAIDGRFEMGSAAKNIPNFVISYNEDQIADNLKKSIEVLDPRLKVKDRKTLEKPDPPFPIERLGMYILKKLKIFTKPS